jgi:hypothetical protein
LLVQTLDLVLDGFALRGIALAFFASGRMSVPLPSLVLNSQSL